MNDKAGNDKTPGPRQTTDESALNFPAGTSKSEKIEKRLDLIENNGRLVIARGSSGAYIGRAIGSVAIGLLGLVVLVLGADGFVALCGVAFIVVFGLVVPIFIFKRYRQDHFLELTSDGFELVRRGQGGEETVHQATWSVVDSVTTVRPGNRPVAPSFPAINVAFASGEGRRSSRRSFLTREHLGERIVLNQPLGIGRWELVELLTAAHQRFKPQRAKAPEDRY